MTADLVEHGTVVGRVATYGGAQAVDVDDAGRFERTRPGQLRRRDRRTARATRSGAFDASDDGYGAWIAPLSVKPQDVRTAEVVSPSGTVIATATLG